MTRSTVGESRTRSPGEAVGFATAADMAALAAANARLVDDVVTAHELGLDVPAIARRFKIDEQAAQKIIDDAAQTK